MAISLARYWVQVRPDFTLFRTEVRAEAARMAAATDFKVRPSLELGAFRAQWAIFAARYLRDQTITIRPVLAPGGLSSSAFRARDLAIKVRLDLTAFRAQWRVFAATYLNVIHRIHVHPVISPTAVSGVIDAMGGMGERGGRSFGRGFTGRWKLIIAAIVATLPLLSPLLSVLGSIVQAASAVGAALPLAFAGLALSVGTLVTVFHNLGKAVKGQFSGAPTKAEQKAFDKLSDSAKKFVGQLLDVRTKLKGFQEEVQEQFFKKFTVGFQVLADSPAIKVLRKAMGQIAADAGAAASGVAGVFASAAKSGQLATLFDGIRGSFRDIAGTLPKLTQMFLTLSVAAQPFVDILVGKLLFGIGSLSQLVAESAKDGRLAKFFDDGMTALLQFSRLLVNLGSIFKTVFDALSGSSKPALETLSVLAGQFAAFLKSAEGQAILKLFADKLQLIGDVIQTVLGPLLPLAIQLAQAISGPLGDGIRQILPGLGNFIDSLVDGLTPVLKILAPIFDLLVEKVADFAVMALREMTFHLDKAMPFLKELAERLGPQLVPMVEAFGEALLALVPLIPAISDGIIAFLPLLIEIIPLLVLMTKVTTFLWQAIAVAIEWIIKIGVATTGIIIIFKLIMPVMDAIGKFFIDLWGHIASWFMGTIVPSLGRAVSDIAGFFRGMWNAIRQDLSDLRAGWDATYKWFRDNIVTPLATLITQTIPNAFRLGVSIVESAWNRLRSVASAPVRFFIETVVNRGIIGTIKAIAKFLPGNLAAGLNEVGLPSGFAGGGRILGLPSAVDNLVARGPDGRPIGLAGGEMVVNARQTAKHLPLLQAINSGMQGYAAGGLIGLLTDPVGWVKDRVGGGGVPGGGVLASILTGAGGRLISGLIEWVKAKMAGLFAGPGGAGPGFLPWPTSPGAQRGDTGVWRSIVALIRATGPLSGSFGNAYRAGDPLWHGSGRAVDWMGFNQDALASFFMARKQNVLELIHRSNSRDYAVTRGQNKGSFSNGLMEEHRNHIHIAMNEGGLLARVFDRGGAWPSGTLGLNTSGRTEQVVNEAVPISLSDATIAALARAIGGVLNGTAAGMWQLSRAR